MHTYVLSLPEIDRTAFMLAGGKGANLGELSRISLIRNFSGYREYPKYGLANRYFAYKQALLQEAEQLLQADVIYEKEDIYYLTFEELREVIRTNRLDYRIISERKDEYKWSGYRT